MEETNKALLGSVTIIPAIAEDIKKTVTSIADFEKKIEEYISQNTTNLLDIILCGAVKLQASDIHIEPQIDRTRLRIRIDGILQDAAFFQKDVYHHLLSRLKLLSKIKLNVTDVPQDGRFTIDIQGVLIEIRTSSLPSEYGESIVMRILNPNNLMGLESLGLRKDLYEILEREIQKPNGLIAVAGPTGSGKTTTLYAFLMKIHTPEVKIITIEDPIEYHLTGINQTQVVPEKGYTFSEGLMSIVRQDPDVILVGEIRDLETAKISLQAALTGHLVLSTIHTNDAAGTIPRLIDLGASPSSIAPALKMVVGQRLIRKVCTACSTLVKPSPVELLELKRGLGGVLERIKITQDLDKIKIAAVKKGGCPACNFVGYKGRKGIFEIFLVDSQMEKFILTEPSVASIRELLIKKGMITIYQSGLIEVVIGETTLDEVHRVIETEGQIISVIPRKEVSKTKKPEKMSFNEICRILGLNPNADLRILIPKLMRINFRLRKKEVLTQEESQQLEKIKKFYRDWNLSMNAADPMFKALIRLKNLPEITKKHNKKPKKGKVKAGKKKK